MLKEKKEIYQHFHNSLKEALLQADRKDSYIIFMMTFYLSHTDLEPGEMGLSGTLDQDEVDILSQHHLLNERNIDKLRPLVSKDLNLDDIPILYRL